MKTRAKSDGRETVDFDKAGEVRNLSICGFSDFAASTNRSRKRACSGVLRKKEGLESSSGSEDHKSTSVNLMS